MELSYFILGILFVQVFIPIIDGVSAWFLTWIEAKKANQSSIINDANIKMRQASASAEQNPPRRPIGFYSPDEEDYTEEE